MINSVVIIDDDPIIKEMLESIAEEQLNIRAESYSSAEQFFSSDRKPTSNNCVYLVDWNLPGIQGPEIVKIIRIKDKISPIFMISGNTDREYILEGLKSGADDYLIKPFEPQELITKLQNARTRSNSIFENLMNIGIKIIPEAHLVIKDGEKLSLTAREFQVFKVLFEQLEKVYSRVEIMAALGETETTERNIDVLVFSLRRKISKLGLEITTVRGSGYKLEVKKR